MVSWRRFLQIASVAAAAAVTLALPASVAGNSTGISLSESHTDFAPLTPPISEYPPKVARPLGDVAGGLIYQPFFDSFSQIVHSEVGLTAFQSYLHRKVLGDDAGFDLGESLADSAARLPLRWADGLSASLLTSGEERLSAFDAVKSIDINYQSQLGGRKWHAGVAALGALHQRGNKLLAYQLQAFAAQDDAIGAGVGAIYRFHTDTALFGGNIFFDYEDGDYDRHTRWSIGGEARSQYAHAHANVYLPISDDAELDDGRTAYTKRGWDFGLGFDHRPRGISGGAVYYRFTGEHGEDDEDGLRYYLAYAPLPQLQLRLEYDDGLGGAVRYRHNLQTADVGTAKSTAAAFDPARYLYEPVRREWTQRIGVVEQTDGIVISGVSGAVAISVNEVAVSVAANSETRHALAATLAVGTGAGGHLTLARPDAWRIAVNPDAQLPTPAGTATQLTYADNTVVLALGKLVYETLDASTRLSTFVVPQGGSTLRISVLGTALTIEVAPAANATAVAIDLVASSIAIHRSDADGNHAAANAGTIIRSIGADAQVFTVAADGTHHEFSLLDDARFDIAADAPVVGTLTVNGSGTAYAFTFTSDDIAQADLNISTANNNEGVITFVGDNAPAAGIYILTVAVRDTATDTTDSAIVTIGITPPVMVDAPATFPIADTFTGRLHIFAPTGGSDSGFAYAVNHANLTVNAAGGELRVTDAFTNALGSHPVQVIVTDNGNASRDSVDFHLIVTPSVRLDAIALTRSSSQSGVIHTFALAAGSDTNTYRWRIANHHPGLSINATTGELTLANPLPQGTYTFDITVDDTTNNTSSTANITLSIVVNVVLEATTFYTHTGSTDSIGTLAPIGSGSYTFDDDHANIAINNAGVLTFVTPPAAADNFTFQAIVTDTYGTADTGDDTRATANIGIDITAPIAQPAPTPATFHKASNFTGTLTTLDEVTGGSGVYSYATNNDAIRINNAREAIINTALAQTNGTPLLVEITATDRNGTAATITLTLTITAPIAQATPAAFHIASNFTGLLVSLASTAGSGSGEGATYTFNAPAHPRLAVDATRGRMQVNLALPATSPSTPYLVPVFVTDNGNGSSATITLTIHITAPITQPTPDPATFDKADNWTGVLVVLDEPTGGSGGSGYTYTTNNSNFIVNASREVVLTASLAANVTVEITVTDSTNGSSAVITLTLNITPAVALADATFTTSTGSPDGVVVGRLQPSGGSGSGVSYTDDRTDVAVEDDGDVVLQSVPASPTTLAVQVTVMDATNGSRATAVVSIGVVNNVAFNQPLYRFDILAGQTAVGNVVASGVAPYGFTHQTDDIDDSKIIIATSGVITFAAAADSTVGNYVLSVTVTDAVNTSATALVSIGVSNPITQPAPTQTAFHFAADFIGAVITLAAPNGGTGDYSYHTNNGNVVVNASRVVRVNTALAQSGSPHQIEITVSDDRNGTADTITLTLTITAPVTQSAPTPAAFHKSSDFTGTLATLPAHGDGSGGGVTYTDDNANISIDANRQVIVNSALAQTNGTPHAVKITVTDDDNGSSATITLTVTITAPVTQTPPTPIAYHKSSSFTGTLATLPAHGGGSSAGVSYSHNHASRLSVSAAREVIITTAFSARATPRQLRIITTDNANGSSATVTLTLTTTAPIAQSAPTPAAFHKSSDFIGTLTTLPAHGDGSGGGVTYTDDNANISIDASRQVIVDTALAQTNGTPHAVKITVTDGANASAATITITITITAPIAQTPPAVVTYNIANTFIGTLATLPAPTGGSGDGVTYTDGRADISVNANREIVVGSALATRSNPYNFRITVADNTNGSEDVITLTLAVSDAVALANTPDTLTFQVPDDTTAAALIHNIIPSAGSGADENDYTFAINNTAYPNASLNTSNGEITFANADTETTARTLAISITVTDNTNASTASKVITLTFESYGIPSHTTPAFAATPDTAFHTVTVVGGTTPISYAVSYPNGNISGVDIATDSSNNGVMSFGDSGSYYFYNDDDDAHAVQVVATDNANETTTATINLQVSNLAAWTDRSDGRYTTYAGSFLNFGGERFFHTLPAGSGQSYGQATYTEVMPSTVTVEFNYQSTSHRLFFAFEAEQPRHAGESYTVRYEVTDQNNVTAPTRFALTITVVDPPAPALAPVTVTAAVAAGLASAPITVTASGGTGIRNAYRYSVVAAVGFGVTTANSSEVGITANNDANNSNNHGVLYLADDYYLQDSDTAFQVHIAVHDANRPDIATVTSTVHIVPTNRIANRADAHFGRDNSFHQPLRFTLYSGSYGYASPIVNLRHYVGASDTTDLAGATNFYPFPTPTPVSPGNIGSTGLLNIVTTIGSEDLRQRDIGDSYEITYDVTADNAARTRFALTITVISPPPLALAAATVTAAIRNAFTNQALSPLTVTATGGTGNTGGGSGYDYSILTVSGASNVRNDNTTPVRIDDNNSPGRVRFVDTSSSRYYIDYNAPTVSIVVKVEDTNNSDDVAPVTTTVAIVPTNRLSLAVTTVLPLSVNAGTATYNFALIQHTFPAGIGNLSYGPVSSTYPKDSEGNSIITQNYLTNSRRNNFTTEGGERKFGERYTVVFDLHGDSNNIAANTRFYIPISVISPPPPQFVVDDSVTDSDINLSLDGIADDLQAILTLTLTTILQDGDDPLPSNYAYTASVISTNPANLASLVTFTNGGGADSHLITVTDAGLVSHAGSITLVIAGTDSPHNQTDTITVVTHTPRPLLIIGGIDEQGTDTALNDVWASSNGKSWSQVQGDGGGRFNGRRSFGAAFLNGTLFVVGGRTQHTQAGLSDVWASTNGGIGWVRITANGPNGNAPFGQRHSFGFTAHNGTLFVVGGATSLGAVLADVWASPDGITWTRLAENANFNTGNNGRVDPVVVFQGSLFVAGGNRVWSSADGATWTQVTSGNAGFGGQTRGHALAVHNSKLYFSGGQTLHPDINESDAVWSSADGATWTEDIARDADGSFGRRQRHAMISFGGKLYVVGGHDEQNPDDVHYSDVWTSTDGATWTRIANGAYPQRNGHALLINPNP